MPLSEMSPNIRETEPAGRKRSHDEFATVIKVEVNEDIKAPVTGTIHLTDAGRKRSCVALTAMTC